MVAQHNSLKHGLTTGRLSSLAEKQAYTTILIGQIIIFNLKALLITAIIVHCDVQN
jgi:hypothetical protein